MLQVLPSSMQRIPPAKFLRFLLFPLLSACALPCLLISMFLFVANSKILGLSIPLNAAVHHKLASAAYLIEASNYSAAVIELDSVMPENSLMANETHYLRGICKQSLGDFVSSYREYSIVLKESNDIDLVSRAIIGQSSSQLGQRIVPESMFYFSSCQGTSSVSP